MKSPHLIGLTGLKPLCGFFAGIIIPAQVYSTFKNDRSIAHKKTIIVFFVVAVIHFSYFDIKLPNLVEEF